MHGESSVMCVELFRTLLLCDADRPLITAILTVGLSRYRQLSGEGFGVLSAEIFLLDLAHGIARQFGRDEDLLRLLELGQFVGKSCLYCLFLERCSRLGGDDGDHGFTEIR